MRGIFTRKQASRFLLISAFIMGTTSASLAQTPRCTEITADFTEGPQGFGGDFTWTDGHLEATFPRDANMVQEFEITSALYQNQSPEGSATVGFTLSGYVRGSSFLVEVLNNSNNVIGSSQTLVLNEDNANANRPTTVCLNVLDTRINQGARIRYRITVFSPDPPGNGAGNVTVIFDDFSVGAIAGIVLPVKIHSLSAKKVATGTQLTWNVGEETNVSHYELQRGTNGADFTTVGLIFAGGKESYSLTDTKPSQGVVFYRIMSVDNDKKYKYSTVISFANGKALGILRAYPMPARNSITVQHALVESKAQISISFQDGKLVKTVTPATGSMETPIDLSSLKAGMYLLRFADASGQAETLKIVKQ